MPIDRQLHRRFALAWLLALVAGHVVLRVLHPDLGPQREAFMIPLFFGLNLPTLALGALLPREQASWGRAFFSPVFLLGMVAIAGNFLLSGASMGGPPDLAGILLVLTAQALWLAFPIWWAARAAARAAAPGGAVGRAARDR